MQGAVIIGHSAGSPGRRFVWHFLEMTLVMCLGMSVLGATFREIHVLAFGGGFDAAWRDHVVLAAFAMAFNMTVPMVLWMRYYCGHSWERGAEMAAAMTLPLVPLLLLDWADVIAPRAVLGLQMALMLPAMLAVMLYRKDEYSASHHRPHRRRRFAAAS